MNLSKKVLGLCGWVLLCFAAAAPGALFMPGAWYDALNKPAWNPPERECRISFFCRQRG